ncbi:hypothetical protein FB451DRAFT_1190156 [Mycena latifolia]|nr:hypothetical protein FB451DRAFT_1190156 [Mycena latifolia]
MVQAGTYLQPKVEIQSAFGNGQRDVSLGSLRIFLEHYSEGLFCQKWFHPDNPPDLGGTAFDPPYRGTISSTEADQMVADRELEREAQGAVVHTAALAAFKLWGDSPESRQYLELAAKINPLILFKILGRIDIPKRPSAQMRRQNGPEDAQVHIARAFSSHLPLMLPSSFLRATSGACKSNGSSCPTIGAYPSTSQAKLMSYDRLAHTNCVHFHASDFSPLKLPPYPSR